MAATNQPPAGTGWSIVSQTPGVGKVGSDVTAGVTINFVTGRGHPGTLFVPNAKYTTDGVRQLLADAALNIDNIGALSG